RAARLDQFAGDHTAILEDMNEGAEALGKPRLQSGVRKHKAKQLRKAAVNLFEIVLKGQIVGEIKLAQARGVAAATEVFQEQRVIELPDFLVAQSDLPPDVNADPATAHAMTFGLSLGEIERVTERTEQFGEAHIRRCGHGTYVEAGHGC